MIVCMKNVILEKDNEFNKEPNGWEGRCVPGGNIMVAYMYVKRLKNGKTKFIFQRMDEKPKLANDLIAYGFKWRNQKQHPGELEGVVDTKCSRELFELCEEALRYNCEKADEIFLQMVMQVYKEAKEILEEKGIKYEED